MRCVVCQIWNAIRHELLKYEYDMNYKTCLNFKHEHDTFNIRVIRDRDEVKISIEGRPDESEVMSSILR